MSENDIIAEYVKAKYPQILKSYDFITWKISIRIREATKKFVDAIKDIDSTELKNLLEGDTK